MCTFVHFLCRHEWREFQPGDTVLECTCTGLVRIKGGTQEYAGHGKSKYNYFTYRATVVDDTRARLVVKNLRRSYAIAACFLPDAGKWLGPDWKTKAGFDVYHLNKDPKDDRASNLVVLTAKEAKKHGLKLCRAKSIRERGHGSLRHS
jgi:hypothetical protein